MTLHCPVEQDLLDALAAMRWPDRADPALRAHVAACRICADVAEVATAFIEDRDASPADPPVPPANAVWWRAQIRAREESARLAARPIVVVQAAATLCVAVASILAAPTASAWLRGVLSALGASGWWSTPRDVSLAWLVGAAAYTTLPLVVVGLWVILAPVVVYLALDD